MADEHRRAGVSGAGLFIKNLLMFVAAAFIAGVLVEVAKRIIVFDLAGRAHVGAEEVSHAA